MKKYNYISIIQESKKQREVLRKHSLVLCVDTSGIICVALKGTFCLLMLCNSWPSNRTDSTPCYRAVNKKNPTWWFLIYGHTAGLCFWEGEVQLKEHLWKFLLPAERALQFDIWLLSQSATCRLLYSSQHWYRCRQVIPCPCFSLHLSIICNLFHSSKNTVLNVTQSRLTKMVKSSLSLSTLRAKSLTPFQIWFIFHYCWGLWLISSLNLWHSPT